MTTPAVTAMQGLYDAAKAVAEAIDGQTDIREETSDVRQFIVQISAGEYRALVAAMVKAAIALPSMPEDK